MDSIPSIFGDIEAPSTFGQLIDLVLSPVAPGDNVVRMWRGHADAGWRIDSSAYRRLLLSGSAPSDRDLIWYEEGLLERATHRGFRVTNGVTLSDFDLLARLQHHGAATRLVDATRSAIIALYFACSSLPNVNGALLGFHANYLGGYEGKPNSKSYSQTVKTLEQHLHPQTWEPPVVSGRIGAQHSQFLYSAISKSDLGSLHISKEKDAFLAIGIKAALKPKFLRVLSEAFDIRVETMFPDIDGFGTSNRFDIDPSHSFRW
jgi:hypothetical protein